MQRRYAAAAHLLSLIRQRQSSGKLTAGLHEVCRELIASFIHSQRVVRNNTNLNNVMIDIHRDDILMAVSRTSIVTVRPSL